MLHVPSPGVDNQQAAVGVLQHVGGVELRVFGGQEVGVLGPKGRPVRDEDVPADSSRVVLGREQIPPVLGGEGRAAVALQAAQGHGREPGQGVAAGRR